jgi:sucrose-6-phosphate hydrolase SacC (GH32 family)
MKRKTGTLIAALCMLCALCLLLTACQSSQAPSATQAPATEAPATEAPATEAPATEGPAAEAPAGEEGIFAEGVNDKDFSALRTPGSQEAAYEYKSFFLPAVDGISQPYVGDTMPYYEDGVYYIYYLKEGGDSYNHSVYLATTPDFVTYTEYDAPVIEASRGGGQDGWIGTGSVVKVKDEYLFFYTGHASSETYEYMEKIMLARGKSLTAFEKAEGWEITPPAEIGQKRDFRDPQAYYDAETDTITLTVTASQDGTARILKYTLSGDLSDVHYDGIIFTNTAENFWNLECSDTFRMGDKYYITYSAQDDTLWYAMSDTPYGPYGEARRLDGKLFYAAKHVESQEGAYMVGWARRSESPSSLSDVSGWAGNLAVQKIVQRENGDLALAPADALKAQFTQRRRLLTEGENLTARAGSRYNYTDAFTAYESFMLEGRFTYTGKGCFGLAFDYNGQAEKYKLITIDPSAQKLQLQFNEGSTLITETAAPLEAGREYAFTYIQEGSVGIFWLEDACLTVRLYGVSGKPVRIYAESNTVNFTGLREYTR